MKKPVSLSTQLTGQLREEAWYEDYDNMTKRFGKGGEQPIMGRNDNAVSKTFWPPGLTPDAFTVWLNWAAFRVHGNYSKPWKVKTANYSKSWQQGPAITIKYSVKDTRNPGPMPRKEFLNFADKFKYDQNSDTLIDSIRKSETNHWPIMLDKVTFLTMINNAAAEMKLQPQLFESSGSPKEMVVMLCEPWSSMLRTTRQSLGQLLQTPGLTCLALNLLQNGDATEEGSLNTTFVSTAETESASSSLPSPPQIPSLPRSLSDKKRRLIQKLTKALMAICCHHLKREETAGRRIMIDVREVIKGTWRVVSPTSLVDSETVDLLPGELFYWNLNQGESSILAWPVTFKFSPQEVPKMCKYYSKGCRHGQGCRFLHEPLQPRRLDEARLKTYDLHELLIHVKIHGILDATTQTRAWKLQYRVRHLFRASSEHDQEQMVQEIIEVMQDMHMHFQTDYADCAAYAAAHADFLRCVEAIMSHDQVLLRGDHQHIDNDDDEDDLVFVSFGMDCCMQQVRRQWASMPIDFQSVFKSVVGSKGEKSWNNDWYLLKSLFKHCKEEGQTPQVQAMAPYVNRLIKVRDNLDHGDLDRIGKLSAPAFTTKIIFDTIQHVLDKMHEILLIPSAEHDQPDQEDHEAELWTQFQEIHLALERVARA